jgi:hypothetical protein
MGLMGSYSHSTLGHYGFKVYNYHPTL